MLDGNKKNQMNKDLGEESDYTEEVPQTGNLGGESESEEEEVTDETIIEDLEEEAE